MGHIVDAWRKQHFAQVPAHGLTSAYLGDAAQSFFAFLDLPEDAKRAICRTLPGEDHRIDIGYMRRRADNDPDAEEKMYFHYHPEVDELFAREIESAGERAQTFLTHARHVWDTTIDIAKDAVAEFETEWPGTKMRFFPPDKTPHLVIRFLAYHAKGEGNFLARAHYDRGTFTIALGESAPGLRIGTPENLKEVEHQEGHVVIMPGTNFSMDVAKEIEPAWHDVVQRSEAQLNRDTARWAVVGFFDVIDKQYIPIEATHVPRA